MRDNRNAIIAIILTTCLVIMMMTILASADANINTSAKSAAVYEPRTQTFSYSKDINRRLPMASTTKIMTGLLAIELAELNEVVEIPPEAVGIEGSSIYLGVGDTLTMRDLIYSLLLQSANDAATAIAIKLGGDIKTFSDMMNKRASDIGLEDTNFDNPHGLDSENHYTTAHDLAILTATALENPTFRKVVSTYKYSFMSGEKQRTVVNHNKLLTSYDGAIGVKTGYTKTSGRCLVSAAERNGVTLIAVTLSAPDDWRDHTTMLDYGFTQYEAVSPYSLVKQEYAIPLMSNEGGGIIAELSDTPTLIRHISEPRITAELAIKQYALLPVKKGDVMGEVVFMAGNRTIAKANYLATESCEENKDRFNIFDLFR